MATPSGSASTPLKPDANAAPPRAAAPVSPGAPASTSTWLSSVEHRLFADEGICSFDFFQSIRLLTLLGLKDRVLVGEDGPPAREIVRFLAHLSLAFPASVIHSLVRGVGTQPPRMTVNFMGLTGPNGALPRPYTERLWTETKGEERTALQDWFDLFNHRFISLFYRAWEKYHFYVPYERCEPSGRNLDPVSLSLFSLIGLGFRSHRNRFRLVYVEKPPPVPHAKGMPVEPAGRETELARLDDLPLLRFGGMFAHRPRCAVSLQVFLQTYLNLPVKVLQFQGQWLHLNRDNQTAVGAMNCQMGLQALVGDRVWDVQSKVRIQLGPLSYETFLDFLPEQTPMRERKRVFLLAQLVQFYVGAEMDVEFQLLLKQDEVPSARTGVQSRLGWNTWSRIQAYPRHADDTVFTVSDRATLNAN